MQSQLSKALQIPINPISKISDGDIACNWSGGASSAAACLLTYRQFGSKCKFVFAETNIEHPETNIEHPETYRFLFDFQQVVGVTIERLQSDKFHEPEDVWRHYKGLKYANGAACSSELKRDTSRKWRNRNSQAYATVIGFDASETERARNMSLNYPELNCIYPLIQLGMGKKDVFDFLVSNKLRPPSVYSEWNNNNCLGDPESPKGGCVQGGIGYWQKIREVFPKKFQYMANIEHELSLHRGEPVTILKDRRGGKSVRMFLLPCEHFPENPSLQDQKGRYKVETFECHGFCGTLPSTKTDTDDE